MIKIICPICRLLMTEMEDGVWYCENDDAKFIEDASGK